MEKYLWLNMFIAWIFKTTEFPVSNRLKEREEMCFVQ